MNLSSYQYIYFAGIGGIGMSALARYFHAEGKVVLGYDRMPTKLTDTLQLEGISIQFQDEITPDFEKFTTENTLVVYTPAIKNLDILQYFRARNFRILKRAQVLGLITEGTTCLAVAGTHGKTTTSSLLAHLCKEAGLEVSCFLGGISENLHSNFFHSGNQYSVVEADEYDRSFLTLAPDWAVITSTDADHLDIYGDSAAIEKSFQDFADQLPDAQQLFCRKGISIQSSGPRYAANEPADFYADNIRESGDHIQFDFHKTSTGETIPFEWEIPGIHNVENATAAIALLSSLGVSYEKLQAGIASFKGIKRRYTKHRFANGKIYIDDYAHHPTELDAVIGSIKTFYPGKKLLVAFQPHLFSRTRDFAQGFADSLSRADELLLLDIYPARELQEDYNEITSDWLLEKVSGTSAQVCTLSEALDHIKQKEFDILLTAGAGNIDTLYDPLVTWQTEVSANY